MIKKTLIANRGEIACRVMKTCKRLGIATVAVYSEADARALHAETADEAVLIGPPPAAESYLCIDKIIAAAKETGADAVHPGYGFLSENEKFAEACAKAGITFIGPPTAAIRAMGGKSAAKALMEKAGVPLVPGYHGAKQDASFLKEQAKKTGYPVLIKASAGGGGKGMRVVEKAADFETSLAAAQREGKASFGDARVLIEKYLRTPRHVEIQIFADTKGNCVYLFERDCSVQRRHQKVIEEAPASGLSAKTREKMGEAAVAAAKAIGYVGAGTVEFLLDGDDFYFMEMNTRLQVEHPVTEMITGLDLVELQIRVAEGKKLPFTQDDLKIDGHAFEARLYAEDPDNDFLPGAGKICYLAFAEGARIDTGVRQGDTISIYYDPMIAKIIVHGKTRAAALKVLNAALDKTHVAGPKSNLNFLRAVARHPAFVKGGVSTRFIPEHREALLPAKTRPSAQTLAAAARGLLNARAAGGSDPWSAAGSWRIGGPVPEVFRFKDAEGEYEIRVHDDRVTLPGGKSCPLPADGVVVLNGTQLTVMYDGRDEDLTYLDPLATGEAEEGHTGRLTAPMPGKVVAVHVKAGAKVKKGQPLIIVEAMKMEHTITAPADGEIAAVNANAGDQVDEKKELVAFK